MSEKITRLSAGVTAREIDLSAVSAPQSVQPTGIPAGVIGTAKQGPAFVPVTVANSKDFISVFGDSKGNEFGPIALREWLRNSNSGTYIRVLGVGDGKEKASSGIVTNSGFVVGQELIGANGDISQNSYANNVDTSGNGGGILGRTYFLGCLMSESNGSTYLSDAGLQRNGVGVDKSVPIVRGVLLAPSGVNLKLNTDYLPAARKTAPTATTLSTPEGPQGSVTGSIANGHQFNLYFNGHKGSGHPSSPINTSRNIQVSFDPTSPQYLTNVLNTDPLKIKEYGHYLYADFPVYSTQAAVTGWGSLDNTTEFSSGAGEPIAFLLTSSLGRAVGSTSVPDFETFETRFNRPISPYIMSQDMGVRHNLFRISALSDGVGAATKYKMSIQNIKPSTDPAYQYGSFDLIVRDFNDTDLNPSILESFTNLSLDPSSERYICRIIGDLKVSFNFDDDADSQSIVVDGSYANNSKYIRIEPSALLESGQVPKTALPFGFRGPFHLQTSGSALNRPDESGSSIVISGAMGDGFVQPPLPMIQKLTIGTGNSSKVNSSIYWGPQFSKIASTTDPNKSFSKSSIVENYTKYFGDFRTDVANMWVGNNEGASVSGHFGIVDSDEFCKNMFALDKVKVVTGSDALANPQEWDNALYVRQGSISANDTAKTRKMTVSDMGKVANRKYGKFTVFMQGGFDGVNIFDSEKSKLSNVAAYREFSNESTQGGIDGPTVASYRKAIDIAATDADVDIQLLAIPGQRNQGVADYAADAIESRFDAMYIMDIEERDTGDNVITGSLQEVHLENTITNFKNRGYNTSFSAAYFPDVIMNHPDQLTTLQVPPSVVVLGSIAQNDTIGFPWFAPAGFGRGALSTTVNSSMMLKKDNLDDLYDTRINPITSFAGTGMVVWGQKTLQQAANALDRVNVRRLLIDLRRVVRDASNRIIFEPNREATLEKLKNLVDPILQNIYDNNGLDAFKVIIDTSTTTQADIDNYTIRGKIIIKPTKVAEFISLDFVVTNQGIEI